VRVTYDVGLGREFLGTELQLPIEDPAAMTDESWRLMRARNKWQSPDDCPHHPFPGTYPVVVTDKADWGGWRPRSRKPPTTRRRKCGLWPAKPGPC
jgi:hypothetical protein